MKKTIFLFSATLLLLSFSKPGEQYPFSKWDPSTLEKANTAKDANGYSDEEKKVVYFTNLVRLNPDLFMKTFAQKYIDSTKTKETSFTRSLKNDLTAKYKPMGVLNVKDDLTEEARSHAEDTGKKGNLGHFTSDGKSYDFRMRKIKESYSAYAECCDYGSNDALSIVMHLLIDEGQASVEHRKILLESKYKFTGASIQPHKKEKWTCVIELGNSK